MENLTFLPAITVFSIFLCTSLLTVLIPKHGKPVSFIFNIVGTIVFVLMLMQKQTFDLTSLIYISESSIRFLFVLSFFNILMAILNGVEGVKNSILASFMLYGSIFLIGATELITFYIALEFVSLMGYVLVGLSALEFSKEAAMKYFIQGAVISAVFVLAMAFFFGSTGSFSITEINVMNQQLYALSMVFFLVVTCFKIGAFPFHTWMPDVYSNVDKGNLATNFLITKLVMGYSFITMLQRFIAESTPEFQQVFVNGILVIAIISAFYGNLIGLAQKQFKRVIAYSSLAHSGYILMTVCLNPGEGYDKQLLFYLTFYAVSATGALLLVNDFLKQGESDDMYESLKGGFYKNGFLALTLSIFVLSLAGIPLTSGFTTKYLLFTNYFREGLTIPALVVLISTVIGLGYYIRFIVVLFMEERDEANFSQVLVLGNARMKLVELILVIAVVAGGIVPSYFIN